MVHKLEILNLKALQTLAGHIAKNSAPGFVMGLKGALGAGKTTFSKYFINYFYPELNVTSPTFNIVQYYNQIAHYDLYRISHVDEFFDLDIWEDFQNKICLIEWPERLGNLMPDKMFILELKIINEHAREVLLHNASSSISALSLIE